MKRSRVYGESACERLYKKLTPKLKSNCRSVQYQTKFYEWSAEELFQEMTILFFNRFEDYYETDNQYVRFLFICMKNKVRTIQQREYKYINRMKNTIQVDYEHGAVQDYNKQFEAVVDHRDFFKVPVTMEYFKEHLGETEFEVLTEVVKRNGSWDKAFSKLGIRREDREQIKKTVISLV